MDSITVDGVVWGRNCCVVVWKVQDVFVQFVVTPRISYYSSLHFSK